MAPKTASTAFVGELRGAMATFSIDRRGCGASADTATYSLEREFEDVAAVVHAVVERTSQPVAVWGHSYLKGPFLASQAVGRLMLAAGHGRSSTYLRGPPLWPVGAIGVGL